MEVRILIYLSSHVSSQAAIDLIIVLYVLHYDGLHALLIYMYSLSIKRIHTVLFITCILYVYMCVCVYACVYMSIIVHVVLQNLFFSAVDRPAV